VAIAIAAMLTPKLLELARALYLATGGLQTLGDTTATLVQIGITALVLGVPCFLTGGTLPAAMKFAQRDDDPNRSTTALFYAINVVGAVTGAALGTFWMLGTVGNQGTLGIAAMANALIGGLAWMISRRVEMNAAPSLPQAPGRSLFARRRAWCPSPSCWRRPSSAASPSSSSNCCWYRVSASLSADRCMASGWCSAWPWRAWDWRLALQSAAEDAEALSGRVHAGLGVGSGGPRYRAMGDRRHTFAFGALVINETTRGFGFGPGRCRVGRRLIVVLLRRPRCWRACSFLRRSPAGGAVTREVGRELGQAYLRNTSGAIVGSRMGGFVLVPALGLNRTWLLVASSDRR